MSNALEIKDLCKSFILAHGGGASLKTALLWWKRKKKEQLQVLRGLSFTVKKGESVALIGRNGAGKSTLLSLIARVYKPTSGTISVSGRLAPLLELGAGFHPDLTGAENVLFNAMILGLTRKEALGRLDSIIAFAELESHRDVPVRSYSSGMLARLGFAVAAHVDAEILIVDEVLAVGDFAFEQKCYDTIESFQAKGGTILFVSHNLESVAKVAKRCLWLEKGQVKMDGAPQEVLSAYRHGPCETEAAPQEN
jgi:lipopolysaccharide transport system ATP-binding protein